MLYLPISNSSPTRRYAPCSDFVSERRGGSRGGEEDFEDFEVESIDSQTTVASDMDNFSSASSVGGRTGPFFGGMWSGSVLDPIWCEVRPQRAVKL